MERHHVAYNTFCNGFQDARLKPPLWDNLEPWVRDALLVAYSQGKLDGGSEKRARIAVAIDQLRATEAKIKHGMPTDRILIAVDMTARDLAGHETSS